MSLKDGIRAIIDTLETAMPSYTWAHGWADTVADRRDLGYVWGTAIRENPDDTNVESVEIGIRLFPNFQQPRGTPRDPSTFEDAAETLQTVLKDEQTTLPIAAGFWYLRITEITIDQELQRVDATVMLWGSNVFAQA